MHARDGDYCRGPEQRNSLVIGGVDGSIPRIAGPEDEALILEDNVIIALDAESILQELGFVRCHIAVSVSEALDIISQNPITFAMLDICLREETCEKVASLLRDRGTSFVFASGYDDSLTLGPGFDSVPNVPKPYSVWDVSNAIARAGLG